MKRSWLTLLLVLLLLLTARPDSLSAQRKRQPTPSPSPTQTPVMTPPPSSPSPSAGENQGNNFVTNTVAILTALTAFVAAIVGLVTAFRTSRASQAKGQQLDAEVQISREREAQLAKDKVGAGADLVNAVTQALRVEDFRRQVLLALIEGNTLHILKTQGNFISNDEINVKFRERLLIELDDDVILKKIGNRGKLAPLLELERLKEQVQLIDFIVTQIANRTPDATTQDANELSKVFNLLRKK